MGPESALKRAARPLVPGRPDAAGAAGGRDRLAGRRHPALGAAPAPRRLSGNVPMPSRRAWCCAGVRDIRDYRIRSSTGEVIAGAAPSTSRRSRFAWATSAKRRRVRSWRSTPRRPASASPRRRWRRCGRRPGAQPWLVNALCAGACFDNKAGRDRSRTIEVDDIYAAREELILSRRTHLDQLAHKLEEERGTAGHRTAAERRGGAAPGSGS